MIDPEFIDPIAKEGLKLLTESGIFRKQIEADRTRLLAGDADEDERAVAIAIKKFRRKAGMLETLHLLGEELKSKENEQ